MIDVFPEVVIRSNIQQFHFMINQIRCLYPETEKLANHFRSIFPVYDMIDIHPEVHMNMIRFNIPDIQSSHMLDKTI